MSSFHHHPFAGSVQFWRPWEASIPPRCCSRSFSSRLSCYCRCKPRFFHLLSSDSPLTSRDRWRAPSFRLECMLLLLRWLLQGPFSAYSTCIGLWQGPCCRCGNGPPSSSSCQDGGAKRDRCCHWIDLFALYSLFGYWGNYDFGHGWHWRRG